MRDCRTSILRVFQKSRLCKRSNIRAAFSHPLLTEHLGTASSAYDALAFYSHCSLTFLFRALCLPALPLLLLLRKNFG